MCGVLGKRDLAPLAVLEEQPVAERGLFPFLGSPGLGQGMVISPSSMYCRILLVSSVSQRRNPMHHGEQKGGGQPEQKHSVQSLQSGHQLPMTFQIQLRVTVACEGVERKEHRRLVLGHRA